MPLYISTAFRNCLRLGSQEFGKLLFLEWQGGVNYLPRGMSVQYSSAARNIFGPSHRNQPLQQISLASAMFLERATGSDY